MMIAFGVAMVALGLMSGCAGGDAGSRQDEVARRGATIMPFDLNKTHHTFEQTEKVESVRALDPKDVEQIRLVRAHLRAEAEKFAAGDFSDPMAIHGRAMPGVAALSAGAERLQIEYAELPDGATITFASKDLALVAAIRDWFTAQVSDHGQHASPN